MWGANHSTVHKPNFRIPQEYPSFAGSCLGLLPGQEWSYISSDSPAKYGVINLSFLFIDLVIDQLLILLFQVTTEKSHAYVLSLFNSSSQLFLLLALFGCQNS